MSANDKVLKEALFALSGKRFLEAERLFKRFLKNQPSHVGALNLLTVALMSMNRFSEAETFIAKAVALYYSSDTSYYNYGLILRNLNRPSEALEQFNIALRINSNVPDTWNNRGTVLNDLGQYERAASDFDRAIALNWRYTQAICNKAHSLIKLKRPNEALASYDRALAFDSGLAEAWLGRGNALWTLRRLDEAVAAYDRALTLKPGLPHAESQRLFSKLCACDWNNLAEDVTSLETSAKKGLGSPSPFVFLTTSSSCREQKEVAKLWVSERFPPRTEMLWKGEIYENERIHLAYVSPDFRHHPLSYLTAGLFEFRDKARFKVTAVSIGADDDSEIRRRIVNSFDEFLDARHLSDDQIGRCLRERKVDILVDLAGFTQDARTGIFTYRPAPVAVGFLGYPGTMGADYIDYIIADRTVIPEDARIHYTENVVFLPNSYYPNDSKRSIFGSPVSRAEAGLPEEGFVYCCFNNNYKILPERFELWMYVLHNVRGSVLWLLEDNTFASTNLRRAAVAQGISGERLVFAKRVPPSEHLARHRLSDLSLDTLPYNAHTTACDALWAGVPVVTQIGSTFAGRVCASLLNAIGLPELITKTRDEYLRLAIGLATQPTRLEEIKSKLEQRRLSMPLFDAVSYVKQLERAYEEIYRRYQAGVLPGDIHVTNVATASTKS
jgi:predicted O-linked N-acetylglucosamine transferase (SPINDLY family)